MFYDLSAREPALEEMDKPDIAPEALQKALHALVRINRIGNGVHLFWPVIRDVFQESQPNTPLRVLDVGCGAGDMAWRLEQRARREGFALCVDGCDMNPTAIDLAQRMATRFGGTGHFFTLDAIHQEVPAGYDVVMSSLFLHHLSDSDTVTVLRRMASAARRRVVVSDLIRSRFGLLLVYLATRTLTRSSVVHRDGVTSLRAAYTMPEMLRLATAAGWTDVRITRRWPERFVMTCRPFRQVSG